MTNNTAAAIAAEIIATTETRIELRAAELHDVDCFRQLCASAVAWLDAEEALQKYPEQSFAQKFGLCNRQKFSGRKIKEGF